ncbi:WXG100 family type VII secretion target [Mycobacterium sp. AZCC_0083]|uniref:WXG100 family type VII secretion target n=1 Tax=Mycobacterium sp. AZCC_0083 TaxID=2735882 RepID=UPI00161090BF|nr:WXG100 family type VII secretion target [Mycobacterium sp. AZCC_0083]MBB5167580.1 uncharacterized protein YukE [Mycobacterium sp. AZCC_0083]
MTLSLTKDQADAKIAQINAARDAAVAKLTQIRDSQDAMLASSWHGQSATTYAKTSAQQHEDFDQIISTLNNIVETGSEHVRSVANLDNG